MSLPIHLRVKKHLKIHNALRTRQYPLEEPDIIYNESILNCEDNRCSLLWINRRTFGITLPFDTSESLIHDVRVSVYKFTSYNNDNIISVTNAKKV